MDRSKWEKIITQFQACARGHLVRSEIHCAREDFAEIVKEIDGGLSHLKWVEAVISTPHFTDTGGPYLQPSDPGLDVSARSQYPASLLQERDHCVLPEKTEAERDDLPSSPVGGDEERQRQSSVGNKDGGVMESTGESSTIWSSLELNAYKGPQRYCLAQEVPRTPQALHLHRNSLTMELLWLQQAIDSRKKYLSLKDRLTVF
ncbi:IQ domain-containing protein C isoform X2 [Acanthochromis polyacanthus]|uniref:IQ domain-containing protein C isoform X2 n=1 Tax=Acanthochromis polyacanthus TaxID=80966 RepID=UPI00223483E3|nr:IQ domain-containing protein C isoform X2 [Acanthochromis polyacanthus]